MAQDWHRRKDDPEAQWNRPRKPAKKKNTREFCRGKPGRPHRMEVVVPANRSRVCQETGWWDRETHQWHRDGRWSCYHAMVCADCGKIDNSWDGDCPDRPPGITQWKRWWTG